MIGVPMKWDRSDESQAEYRSKLPLTSEPKWCTRCQRFHKAMTQADWDKMIQEKMDGIAKAIEDKIMEDIFK